MLKPTVFGLGARAVHGPVVGNDFALAGVLEEVRASVDPRGAVVQVLVDGGPEPAFGLGEDPRVWVVWVVHRGADTEDLQEDRASGSASFAARKTV